MRTKYLALLFSVDGEGERRWVLVKQRRQTQGGFRHRFLCRSAEGLSLRKQRVPYWKYLEKLCQMGFLIGVLRAYCKQTLSLELEKLSPR